MTSFMRYILLSLILVIAGCSGEPEDQPEESTQFIEETKAIEETKVTEEKQIFEDGKIIDKEKDDAKEKLRSQTYQYFNSYTPQLWSHHQILEESAEDCAQNGVNTLQSLGFKQVVKNGTYVYGNFKRNRAAIKCVSMNSQTFVYTAVAGKDVKLVEKLRNKIARML